MWTRSKGAIRETLELHPDRQSALQLSEHVFWLAGVEGSGAYKQDVVGVDVAVVGADYAALYYRQQIPLDALCACIRACTSQILLRAAQTLNPKPYTCASYTSRCNDQTTGF